MTIEIQEIPEYPSDPPEVYAAIVNAAVIRAQIRITAMQAKNIADQQVGMYITYGYTEFMAVIIEEGLDRVMKL